MEMHSLELLFVVALVLYTLVIWTHRKKHKLYLWMIWTFGIALVADTSGTIFLCAINTTKWTWTYHTISGLTSLFIMALHFTWAFLALTVGGRFEAYFNRFSIFAWLLWLTAFVSGIPFAG